MLVQITISNRITITQSGISRKWDCEKEVLTAAKLELKISGGREERKNERREKREHKEGKGRAVARYVLVEGERLQTSVFLQQTFNSPGKGLQIYGESKK